MKHEHFTALPLYRSHKLVRAAKIVGYTHGGGAILLDLEATVDPLRYPAAKVEGDWLAKRVPPGVNPVGGYFVVYNDGYTSWSPAPQFEEGNKLLDAADLAELLQERLNGEFPQGSANVHDEGALALAVSLADAPTGSMVRIDFGKPTAWLGMPPQQAVQFASLILKTARKAGAVTTLHL